MGNGGNASGNSGYGGSTGSGQGYSGGGSGGGGSTMGNNNATGTNFGGGSGANSNESIGGGRTGSSSSNNAATAGVGSVGSRQAVAEQGASGGSNTSAEGYIVGQPPSEKSVSEQTSQSTDKQSTDNQSSGRRMMPLRPGEWQPHEKPPTIKPEEEKPDEKRDSRHQKSLASKRGRDWALPDAANGSVPITRPIRVECRSDQLLIVPEAGLSGVKAISLGARTETSTQAFISAVWDHMETWGIAGRGMYWRPVLNVYVAPGAEQRFADLQMLLDGSGLKVVRK